MEARPADFMQVMSGSMAPLIRTGDYVLIERSGAGGLRLFDVAVFVPGLYPGPDGYDRLPFAHRLWMRIRRKGRSWLLTKGDAVLWFDPLQEPENCLGRVLAVSTDQGWVEIASRSFFTKGAEAIRHWIVCLRGEGLAGVARRMTFGLVSCVPRFWARWLRLRLIEAEARPPQIFR